MKTKYNKKRNTAFVYEALVREGTSAILQGDHERKNTLLLIQSCTKTCNAISLFTKPLVWRKKLVRRLLERLNLLAVF